MSDTSDNNIIDLNTARRRSQLDSRDVQSLIGRMDELEEMLETMDELGISTRAELASLLDRLEKEFGDDTE